MSISLSPNIPANVVEIGQEITQGVVDALNNSSAPTSANPYLTVSAGDNNYLVKAGGGTVVGTVVVDTDGTVGGNVTTINGTSVEVDNFGVGAIQIDPVLGVTFPDNTSQGTAAIFYNQSLNTTSSVAFSQLQVGPSPGLFATVSPTNFTVLDFTPPGAPVVQSQLGASGLSLNQSGAGITFPDSTLQTTAAKPAVDIQTFGSSTTSGTFTWNKPAGAKLVQVRMCGGGGGGGSGACQGGSLTRSGGGGGGGSPWAFVQIPASELPDQVTVIVGAGGAGGAGRTSGNSTGGTDGGNSRFHWYQVLRGTASTGTVGASGLVGHLFNLAGTTTTGTAGSGQSGVGLNATGLTNGFFLGTGGGGGGGTLGATLVSAGGGAGGTRTGNTSPAGYTVTLAGGAGGTTAGVPATNGTNGDVPYASGTGGGGGFYIVGQNGNNGGNGGWPGGGGGGGGAADSGFTSGAGGNGANGVVIVTTFF
jgi:hypothetical protein